MKHIKEFNDFVNESLFASKKPSAADLAKLMSTSKLTTGESLEDFKSMFSEYYNTAADMWLDEDRWIELKRMYAAGKDDFMCIGGESSDGSEDSKMEDARKKGWKIFADEQNYDNYDCILHKKK